MKKYFLVFLLKGENRGQSSATAAAHVKTEAAIIAGRIKFEIHPWWTAKGSYQYK